MDNRQSIRISKEIWDQISHVALIDGRGVGKHVTWLIRKDIQRAKRGGYFDGGVDQIEEAGKDGT